MRRSPTIAFFGSSLVSSYWNGAATYYRGLLRALSALGYRITFFEPDAFDRQAHRDIPDPSWAEVVVYPATGAGVSGALDAARRADIVVKASGVGVFDEWLEREVPGLRAPDRAAIFWDVDAPATLERIRRNPADPFPAHLPHYDLVLTYGGGAPVISAYLALGARDCIPVYNALDPSTHFRVRPDPRFACDLGFLGNRLPDREERVHEFFFKPAALLPEYTFLLGGSGWETNRPDLPNVRYAGHVYTHEHNAFNSSARMVLNINRAGMARFGYSPATRIFEAAGAGACLITDAWEGIEEFLQPGAEILVADSGEAVAGYLDSIPETRAHALGAAAARRITACHTYARRATQVDAIFRARLPGGRRYPTGAGRTLPEDRAGNPNAPPRS